MKFNYSNLNSTKKVVCFLALSTILVSIDQYSKLFFIRYLKTDPEHTLNILPFLNIVYAWNHGISFGMFKEYYQYSNYIFLYLNSVITIYVIYLVFKVESYGSFIGLTCIISGAIGNLLDRLIYGAVFDFISFYYQNFYFPSFNIADSLITIGALIFILEHFFIKKT